MNKNKSHVTWGGRFENSPSQLMISISESVSFDQVLAKYDIKVSKASKSTQNESKQMYPNILQNNLH